jgi:cell division septation protein DedD
MPLITIDRATAWKLSALACAGGVLLFLAGFLAGAGMMSGAAESVLREAQRIAAAGGEAAAGPSLAPITAAPMGGVPIISAPVLPSGLAPAGLGNVAHATGGYSVQVGAYPDPTSAERLARDARNRGLDARVVAESDGAGRAWHAVRVGRMPDRVAASLLAGELRTRHGLSGFVVRDAGTATGLEIAR